MFVVPQVRASLFARSLAHSLSHERTCALFRARPLPPPPHTEQVVALKHELEASKEAARLAVDRAEAAAASLLKRVVSFSSSSLAPSLAPGPPHHDFTLSRSLTCILSLAGGTRHTYARTHARTHAPLTHMLAGKRGYGGNCAYAHTQEAEMTEEKARIEGKCREAEEARAAQEAQLSHALAELERLRSTEDVLLADIATLRAALLRAEQEGGRGATMENVEQECAREKAERVAERQHARAAAKQAKELEERLAKATRSLALAQVSRPPLRPCQRVTCLRPTSCGPTPLSVCAETAIGVITRG